MNSFPHRRILVIEDDVETASQIDDSRSRFGYHRRRCARAGLATDYTLITTERERFQTVTWAGRKLTGARKVWRLVLDRHRARRRA